MKQPDIERVLHEDFDHKAFRPGQKEVITSVLKGKDVIAVLPTGAGKSITYQLLSQVLPGITLVVSPLIALMKDQVDSMEEIGHSAALINSAKKTSEINETLEQAKEGNTKLLYITPERFENHEFLEALKQMKLSLIVVDEAHCIAQWGQDFRPSYMFLPFYFNQIGKPPVLALTATAPEHIRQEIIANLNLNNPETLVYGIDRPNLYFEVIRVEEEREDFNQLEKLFFHDAEQPQKSESDGDIESCMKGSGVIYTATTKGAEETAQWLNSRGIKADYYHGKRTKKERDHVQEAFMNNKVRVIAATNAFGLGIDKHDIRFVIHKDIPATVEAYYQEAGRAGRDGNLARCTILYRPNDLGRAKFLSGTDRLTKRELYKGIRNIRKLTSGTLEEYITASGLHRGDFARLLHILESQKLIKSDGINLKIESHKIDGSKLSLDQESIRKAFERSRWEMIRTYAETKECRRKFLVTYLGDSFESTACMMCDNDNIDGIVVESVEPFTTEFSQGGIVQHNVWGQGTIQDVTATSLTILFQDIGYKILDIETIKQTNILQVIS
jgi:ATP-dependent DNA helicase RecQ